MKETGITRKLDELGRIVIPKEIRNNFKIEEGDQIEFYLKDNEIIIKKPSPLKGLDDEIYKLFQVYNLRLHNSLAIIESSNILLGYGKDTKKIKESLPSAYFDFLFPKFCFHHFQCLKKCPYFAFFSKVTKLTKVYYFAISYLYLFILV